MALRPHYCRICGSAVVRAPAEICPLHLRTSEWQLLAEQANKPSGWVLAAGPAAVHPSSPVAARAEPAAGDIVLAGFWRRLFAFVMDVLGATVIAGLLAAFGSSSLEAAILVALVGWWGYFLLANTFGQLGGKVTLGIKVIDPVTGREPGLAKGALRTLGQAITIFLTLGLGFLIMIGNRRKMALHDYLALTVVVRTRSDRR